MLYEQFLDAIKQEVENRLSPSCQVGLVHVRKNNGTYLDGLTFTQGASCFSPTVYLETFYQEYLKGNTLPHIADLLLAVYQKEQPFPTENLNRLTSFVHAREHVAFKLVNTDANREFLLTVPHREFLDLSVLYYLLVDDDEERQLTSTIALSHMDSWGIDEEALYRLALSNTPRLLPACIDSMASVMERLTGRSSPKDPSGLFVLTNQKGLAGDACILYPGILKDFAERIGSDLIILPSSIHEVLLMTLDESIQYGELNRMIQLINQAEVPKEDRLSSHIYLYSREADHIAIPQGLSFADLRLCE